MYKPYLEELIELYSKQCAIEMDISYICTSDDFALNVGIPAKSVFQGESWGQSLENEGLEFIEALSQVDKSFIFFKYDRNK
ncbi:hypothetical protein [Peribacillus simplex]|uniref:hypothetical protein n=1 Tax=Peribacillus simplex TaxID=1478 RepID=UPI003D27D0F6